MYWRHDMSVLNLKTAALAIAAGVGLSGCAYGPYGGVGVGVGYGNGYGYDPYYGGGYYGAGYGDYGYGYGQPYYGWYNGYYYPGTGYYVYDRYRRPHRWSDTQRRYWEWRRHGAQTSSRGTGRILENWVDFQNGRRPENRVIRDRQAQSNQAVRREMTAEQRAAWAERRQQATEQRAARRAARAESSDEGRSDRRTRRGRNRD
jgi:hypothetical protein